jgi:hypothetical protein
MVEYEILKDGNLKISLDRFGSQYFEENADRLDLHDLLEEMTANGWDWLDDNDMEALGWLTSCSLVLAQNVLRDGDGDAIDCQDYWYFDDYMIADELEELKQKGFIILQKG